MKFQLYTVGAIRRLLLVLSKNCFFRADADPEQYSFDIKGILLSYQHASRLLADPKAEDRARAAFEALLRAVRL